MKKVIYSFLMLSLVFASCDPLEDVYDELDAQGTAGIIGDIAFKMEADDYELTGDDDITDAEAFGTFAQAENLIPTVLDAKFPVWDNGSSALVSFDYDLLSTVLTEDDYELVDQDYFDQGNSFPNFGRNHPEEAKAFLNVRYPDAVRGDLIELTYKFFDGGVNDVVAKFVYTDEWIAPYELVRDDYDAIGQRFPNFDDFDEASFKIGVYLGTLADNLFAQEGDKRDILYTYTYVDDNGRQFEDILLTYTYNGLQWKTDDNTIQFGKENGVWVKDNTIKYTFGSGDYSTVGNSSVLAADASFTDALENLNRFGNFNRTGGGTSWSDEMMITAIGIVLDDINPSAADGQKYVVTVSIFDGASGVENFALVKEAGVWVAQ